MKHHIVPSVAMDTENLSLVTAFTAETLIALVNTWTDLLPARRARLISGVRSFDRMTGQPPGTTLLTPANLRRLLPGRSPMAYNLTVSNMRNIMALASYALCRAGIIADGRTPLNKAWAELLDKMDPLGRAGLMRFGRYCSRLQIDPAEVTLVTLAAFDAYLIDSTLEPKPRRLVGKLRSAWNKACENIAGWPGQPLIIPEAAHDYILPPQAFPASFQADLPTLGRQAVTNFFNHRRDRQRSADEADATRSHKLGNPVRRITQEEREGHARWAASAVVASGVSIDQITSLISLVIPLGRAIDAIERVWNRAGQKSSSNGHHVANILIFIAKHHANLPAAELDELRQAARHVTRRYKEMTQKNQDCMRKMRNPQREAAFLGLPEALMKAARKLDDQAIARGRSRIEPARLAMRAVAIEFLIHIPVRVKNLCETQIDRHLQRDDPPYGRITFLTILADEMKGKASYLVPVPEALAAIIEEWNTRFRPVLAAPECRYLFPGNGTGDKPMTRQGMTAALKEITEQHLGVAISPHRFRSLAAQLFLNAFPGHDEEVRRMLAHASMDTTRRHYIVPGNEASMRRYDEVILAKRTSLKTARPKAAAPKLRKGRS